jgi:hypothetical protein
MQGMVTIDLFKPFALCLLFLIFALEDFGWVEGYLGSGTRTADTLDIMRCVGVNLQASGGIHVEPLLHTRQKSAMSRLQVFNQTLKATQMLLILFAKQQLLN